MRFSSRRRPIAVLSLLLAIALAVGIVTEMRPGFAQEGGTVNMNPATPNALGPAVPPEVANNPNDWVVPMGNYQAHRAAANSPISTQNVGQLNPAWMFQLSAVSAFGSATAVPIVVGDTIYYQDMKSNVFALDRNSGQVKWQHMYNVATEGPNGVAIGYGLLYGSLGNTAEVFALDANTGQEVWRIRLSFNDQIGVDMVPTVYNNIVYVSTVPGTSQNFYQGGQKGIFYALDAKSGVELWEFDTTTDNLWGNARINSGGGLWYPPAIDANGNIFFGVGNAAPWPGTSDYPNATSRPGPNDYASSMVSLDQNTGAVRWFINAKPHDLFDLDFQLTPILADVQVNGQTRSMAIGSGKAGLVVAADAATGQELWRTSVGMHQNDDTQEIPAGQTITVLPGPLGGTETPMAYADGVIYVPVVNMPTDYTATGLDIKSIDYGKATGELVALNAADGSVKWQVNLPTMALGGAVVANDVVFTGGLDGMVRGFSIADGSQVWSYQLGSGINAPLAISGDTLYVPAGGFLIPPAGTTQVTPEATPAAGAPPPAGTPAAATGAPKNVLVAFKIGASGTPVMTAATPTGG